ncbi:unnamed protein product [Trichobilharzia regenti]|nr:unnamed protein product [Trichobilharzia regenti]
MSYSPHHGGANKRSAYLGKDGLPNLDSLKISNKDTNIDKEYKTDPGSLMNGAVAKLANGVSPVEGYVGYSNLPNQENGVYLKLNLIDTPGFGDCIDNTDCWQPVLDYIVSRFDDYISGESRVNRPCQSIPDQRVHACIYFIAPTGK